MKLLTVLVPILMCFGLADAKHKHKQPKPHKSDVIIHQLDLIANETTRLHDTLIAWDGSLTGALTISGRTGALVDTLEAAADTVTKDSPKLGVPSALRVKRATKAMMGKTRETVQTIMDFEYRFRAITLSGQVKASLVNTREASQKLNDAIEPKIPKIGRPIARRLGKKIDKIFKAAIDEYADGPDR